MKLPLPSFLNNFIFFILFCTLPSLGLLPVLVVQTPTLAQPCLVALGLVLIWVERQVVRMMLLLYERERLILLHEITTDHEEM